VTRAQPLLPRDSDRKASGPQSPATPRGPVVIHDLKGLKPAELSQTDLRNVRVNRSGADQLLAQFMYSNPDMALASKLVQQGAKPLSFDALLTDKHQVVIPDCPLWVARGLDGGDPPCFPAAVLGCLTAGGARTGLLIQVGTPPGRLHWRDAFVTRALDRNASMVLIPLEKIAAFGLLTPSRGSRNTSQARIHEKSFIPVKDLAVHLRPGDGVLMRTQWHSDTWWGGKKVDLCLSASFVRRTDRELVFHGAWAPPSAGGEPARWPPDMLGVVDGLVGKLQASRVFTLRTGLDPRYEFNLDLGKAKCDVAFDVAATGKPVPVAPSRGTRLTMDDMPPMRRGENLRVNGEACTFVEHGKKANQIKVLFPGGSTAVDVTKDYVELG
jgi:hypothetical protein